MMCVCDISIMTNYSPLLIKKPIVHDFKTGQCKALKNFQLNFVLFYCVASHVAECFEMKLDQLVVKRVELA
ncbi:hypothetical protein CFPU101_44700 [Chroococcus sp. FPU101]|nr:hypothetical protein CFPU101_44700 [Chroococcus sp. FPU101]